MELKPLWNDFQYKEHQVTGVTWMLKRESAANEVRGGILCDEMGLGKTIQMVALIRNSAKTLREQTLLIAPVAVLEQWKTVIRRAGMTVKVPAPSGLTWMVQGPMKSGIAPQVCVIGYEAAMSKKSLVTGHTYNRCIYDEAHRIAGNNSGTELARMIHVNHMWLLTATPIVNKVRDLSTLLEIVGVKVPPVASLESLAPAIQMYVMSRTMEQLRATIPDAPPRPVHHTLTLDFKTEEEAEFYRGIQGILTRRWKALEADSGAGAALEKLRLFMRLRQISLHPQVYIAAQKKRFKHIYARPDWTASSTKFDAICELMKSETTSHKWILFCHFHTEMEILANVLRTHSCIETVQLYHGGLSAAEKEDVLQRTHMPVAEGKQEVLLVQLQSGGTGLNLQHFDRILFTGPWWTNALMEQAVGRAVRIGQRSVVHVYHLRLAEEDALNIDHIMHEKADAKGKLCRDVLDTSNTAVKLEELADGYSVSSIIPMSKTITHSVELDSDEEDPIVV